MLVGFGREPLRPPLPFDPQGQLARVAPVHEVDEALGVTACVLRDGPLTVAIVAADVLAHTPAFARQARAQVAAAIAGRATDVLLHAVHTHAGLWPGRQRKVSGADLGRWWPGEREYLAGLPEVYASAARRALAGAVEARAAWAGASVPGLVGNRRERTADGRVVIGWDPQGEVDETVSVLRFDDRAGRTLGTVVGFACHPVVLGHEVPRASADFVGPLRTTVEASSGGLCLFLQGAAGDLQPREALHAASGPEQAFGRRVGLEAAHAAADLVPWPRRTVRRSLGRWAPTTVYRSEPARRPPPQSLAVGSARLRLPLGPLPDEPALRAELADLERRGVELAREQGMVPNGVTVQADWARTLLGRLARGPLPRTVEAEVWVARIGEAALVGVSAEPFSALGQAIRSASPAAWTFVAGSCGGVLGYVPTAAAIAEGGFEPERGHRVYGAPACVAPDAGDRIAATAARLLGALFPAAPHRGAVTGRPPATRALRSTA